MKKGLLLTGLVVVAVAAAAASFVGRPQGHPAAPTAANVAQLVSAPSDGSAAPDEVLETAAPPRVLAEPIDNAAARVTKKTFGLKVSPGHSPVVPERFSGYHTGIDLETAPEEQNADVPVRAVCDGALAVKEYAGGYGGVVVQRCRLDGADVTVVYGHLRLSSVAAKAGDVLRAGEDLGVLGTGYSKETDGERKHLHLSIHRGTAINIRGYVQTQEELRNWIDPLPLLKQD